MLRRTPLLRRDVFFQQAAVWLLTIAAVFAINRSLVRDLEVRLAQRAFLQQEGPLVIKEVRDDVETRALRIPVAGVEPGHLIRAFASPRSGGRSHKALDILAPRNTPVLAAGPGTIVDLSTSKLGGISIHQMDPSNHYVYFYAHLQRYAKGLKEGDVVRKGQVIGFVGTTGNAPRHVPHLHFAIVRLTPEQRWWKGTPIDPYDVLVPPRRLAEAESPVMSAR